MALTPGQDTRDSATARGTLPSTIVPLPTPATGDQDVRNFPSNGAIPDAVRGLIPPAGFHVP